MLMPVQAEPPASRQCTVAVETALGSVMVASIATMLPAATGPVGTECTIVGPASSVAVTVKTAGVAGAVDGSTLALAPAAESIADT
jgi:hypothetical protein